MARPIRRNIAHLTGPERDKYIAAVVAADKRKWSGGDISFWDFQDLAHQTTHIHSSPPAFDNAKFLLWHRELCNRYEKLLQQIDPDVALHYWDWTTDPRSSPDGTGGTTDLSVNTFMGTMFGDVGGALAPLHNGGNPAGSRDVTGNPVDPPQTIARHLPPGAPTIQGGAVPTDASIIATGNTQTQAQQWRAFRLQLERTHGGVHVAFGAGNIGDPSGHDAFQDPFVFLLHANVDRLYAMWQCQPGQEWRLDPALVYGNDANSTGDNGLKGNTLAPWDGSSGVHPFTPATGLIEVRPYLDPSLVVPPCYDTLPTTVSKVAPAGATPLRFIDVPTGDTTARALRLEVRSCGQVQVTGVLTGDPAFSLHQGTVQSPTHDDFSTETVFMWVKYKAGAPSSTANGHLRATCTETGDVFDIDIVANSITKRTVAVSMVLDSSGSMSSPSGVPGLDRMAILHQAAPTFVALLDDTDGVGVVGFDTDATPVSAVTVAGSIGSGDGKDSATAAVNAHATNLAGLTAIGDGIEAAHNQLVGVPFFQSAILVFTDGEETASKRISDVISLINERVYAVGLGTPDQLSPTGLTAITKGTGGYLTMTDQLGVDGVMRLAKYFSQVLAGVTNAQIVTDPPGFVLPTRTEQVSFPLTEADQRCDVIVLTEAPDAVKLTLTAPDGTVVSAGPDATAIDAAAMRCLRLPLPVSSAPQAHGGTWTANIDLDEGSLRKYINELEERHDVVGMERLRAHGLAYILNVHAVSDLRMVVTTAQSGHVPGSVVEVLAVLTESGIPLERQAAVSVDVTMPDGTMSTVALQENEPGVHTATLPLPQLGHYPLLVKAEGQSFSGTPFTRQELRSAATWRDPTDRPPRETGDGMQWCELLLCILDDEGIRRALEERGVNIEEVRDCVKRFCERQ
jgi:hypothetical protein